MMRTTSRWCGPVSAGWVLLSVVGLRADHLRNVELGQPLPPFRTEGLDGKKVGSKDVEGKVLVLVYLSAKQRQSEEAMASVHRVVGRIGHKDLKLVYMSAHVEEARYFRQLRDRLMAHEPFALDPGRRYYGQLGLIAFPTTVVTTPDGELLHVFASWTRNYEHHLDVYCRHALGEYDEAEMTRRLTAKPVVKNEARAKAERHRSMADILRKKGMTKGAIQELERAISADPTFHDAVVDLAEMLVARKKLDEAEKHINDLIAKQPRFHRAKLTLGLIQLRRGRLDQAEKTLTEALLLNPDPIRAHYYLGQLYEKKEEHKKAMEHYRDALKRCLNET